VGWAGGWAFFQAFLQGLRGLADKHGVSVSRVALRYVLRHPAVAAVCVGARDARHLPLNVRAVLPGGGAAAGEEGEEGEGGAGDAAGEAIAGAEARAEADGWAEGAGAGGGGGGGGGAGREAEDSFDLDAEDLALIEELRAGKKTPWASAGLALHDVYGFERLRHPPSFEL
jgi:hypothetical protein